MSQLQRRVATPAKTGSQVGLALLDFAAQRAIFLFKTGDIAIHQQFGLVDPIVASDATGKCAELGINLDNIPRRPIGDLIKACDAQCLQ